MSSVICATPLTIPAKVRDPSTVSEVVVPPPLLSEMPVPPPFSSIDENGSIFQGSNVSSFVLPSNTIPSNFFVLVVNQGSNSPPTDR